jgi:hypothetical protein
MDMPYRIRGRQKNKRPERRAFRGAKEISARLRVRILQPRLSLRGPPALSPDLRPIPYEIGDQRSSVERIGGVELVDNLIEHSRTLPHLAKRWRQPG